MQVAAGDPCAAQSDSLFDDFLRDNIKRAPDDPLNVDTRRAAERQAVRAAAMHALGRAVQVDSIKTHVEGAYGFIA